MNYYFMMFSLYEIIKHRMCVNREYDLNNIINMSKVYISIRLSTIYIYIYILYIYYRYRYLDVTTIYDILS